MPRGGAGKHTRRSAFSRPGGETMREQFVENRMSSLPVNQNTDTPANPAQESAAGA